MKVDDIILNEISSRVNIDILTQVAIALSVTTSNEWDTDAGAQGFKILEQYYNHPQLQPFMYRGKMYRAFLDEFELEKEEILQYKSSRKLFSFSKRPEGVKNWIQNLSTDEDDEVITFTEQTGMGYDVQKIYRYVNQFSDEDILKHGRDENTRTHRDMAVSSLRRAGGTPKKHHGQYVNFIGPVYEVVAPIDNSIEVIDDETEYNPSIQW